LGERKNSDDKETRACECLHESAEDEMKSHNSLAGSLGLRGGRVKGRCIEALRDEHRECGSRKTEGKRRDTEFTEREKNCQSLMDQSASAWNPSRKFFSMDGEALGKANDSSEREW